MERMNVDGTRIRLVLTHITGRTNELVSIIQPADTQDHDVRVVGEPS